MPDLSAPPYGPLKKSPLALLFFIVPAFAMCGMALWLALEDAASLAAALTAPVFVICAILGAASLVWGAVFLSRPIVTLTPDAVVWPNGRRLPWSDVSAVGAGQSTTSVASTQSATRTVVHEVMRLSHGKDTTKIVTTWAAVGPEAANNRIAAAFAQSKSA